MSKEKLLFTGIGSSGAGNDNPFMSFGFNNNEIKDQANPHLTKGLFEDETKETLLFSGIPSASGVNANLFGSFGDVQWTFDESNENSVDLQPRKPRRKTMLRKEGAKYSLYQKSFNHESLYVDVKNVRVKGGLMMPHYEIHSVARSQLRDLTIENPYVEDYYFVIAQMKKRGEPVPSFIQWILDHVAEATRTDCDDDDEFQYSQRSFGRVQSQKSTLAQKNVVDGVEIESVPTQLKIFTKNSMQILSIIESAFDILIDIEDLSIVNSKEDSQKEFISRFFELTTSKLFEIFKIPKGKKLIAKALRTIGFGQEILCLEILKNWQRISQLVSNDTEFIGSFNRAIIKLPPKKSSALLSFINGLEWHKDKDLSLLLIALISSAAKSNKPKDKFSVAFKQFFQNGVNQNLFTELFKNYEQKYGESLLQAINLYDNSLQSKLSSIPRK